jgi:hypothetical protein
MMLEMAGPVKKLLGSGPMIRDLMSVVAEKRATTDQIIMISDADSYFFEKEWNEEEEDTLGFRDRRRLAEREEEIAEQIGIGRIVIKGLTRETSLSTVKQLITELTALDFVASADLLADDEVIVLPDGAAEGRISERPFVIDVTLVTL